MVYLICGENKLLVKKRADELIFKFEEKYGKENTEKFLWDADEDDNLGEINNFLGTPSLFGNKKIFVVKGGFGGKIEGLEEILKSRDIVSQKDLLAVLVVFSNKNQFSKNNQKLWKFLLASGAVVEEFKDLKGSALTNWVKRGFARRGIKITPGALGRFVFYTRGDIQLAEQEINKFYCYAGSQTIEEVDVDTVAAKNENIGGFSVVDAVCARNKAKAIENFHDYSSSGQDLRMLFGAFVYQFRNLLSVKDMASRGVAYGEISKKLKLHPYVLRKTYDMASKFNLHDLKVAYKNIAETEKSIKSGGIGIYEGIFDFITHL